MTRLARTIMIQGTASSAGKSLMTTALCRIFHQEGLRVAPFKSQNMSNNSFVTCEAGSPVRGEIGRAQAVQAEAAGVPPSILMNPILLKPEADAKSQVIVMGKSLGSMTAREYHDAKPGLLNQVAAALSDLRARYDIVVIEGAGSPAEINLKDNDIVNMRIAEMADAPVLLVGDIDRGGVFASLVGTMELLEPSERARIAGYIINKFRGDASLLDSGLEFLKTRTGVPVIGVVPFVMNLRIADEDSVSLDHRRNRIAGDNDVDIAVVRLPRISNFDDFAPLEQEASVVVRFIENADDIGNADLVILPGSKTTVLDLEWIKANGFAEKILDRARRDAPVLGICAGFQMLGESIDDPHRIESQSKNVSGLGLLPVRTRFQKEKMTAQVHGKLLGNCFLFDKTECDITAYEIHHGVVEPIPDFGVSPVIEICSRNGASVSIPDGACMAENSVVGTTLHGLFDNAGVREGLINYLRRQKGPSAVSYVNKFTSSDPLDHVSLLTYDTHEAEYDRLADIVRANVDMKLIRRLVGLA